MKKMHYYVKTLMIIKIEKPFKTRELKLHNRKKKNNFSQFAVYKEIFAYFRDVTNANLVLLFLDFCRLWIRLSFILSLFEQKFEQTP